MKKILLAITCLWAACISCSDDTKIGAPDEILPDYVLPQGLRRRQTIGLSKYSIPTRLTCFIITRKKMLFGRRHRQAVVRKPIG